MSIYWSGDGLEDIYAIREGESKSDRKRRLAREAGRRHRARSRGVEGVPFWPVNKARTLTKEHKEKIRAAVSGQGHPAWTGDQVSEKGGRKRALRLYRDIGPCVICGMPRAERHHVDGNTWNNAPENVAILCRRCHMTEDGRLARFIQEGRDHLPEMVKRAAEVRRAKTECKRGHPFSGDNLYISPAGIRSCRECRRQRDRKSA